ncbi:MAG: aminotransferase class I/II-fold pyridoxal phosphate-dependent enzyme [Cyclobacteriaceae bacterium]
MAKIRHNDILDTVDSVLKISKERGAIHLYAEDNSLDGSSLTLNGKKVLHFGTCGYLGLEHHPMLKKGAIDAIERFGTQFPMSRTYISNPLYTELEYLVQKMYDAPIVISKNCTLSHLTTIPSIVKQNDLVILDHQVHASIQEAVKKQLSQGVTVEMIRHCNLEMLEDRIKKQRNKFDKIWYMSDGVYSMFGDYAPIKDLIALAEKYEQLYLYIDDAHGMSWTGKHGTGYVMSQMDKLYHKMVLTANMGKGFGSCGGMSVFPNEEMYNKVKLFGGPLTFSVQMEPAVLGACVASAKIHLSDEIYSYQQELKEKIDYTNELFSQTDLPLIQVNDSPIFFVGTGTMEMGNYLVHELIEDGIYVNLATFPAVPAKNIGVRITISRKNSKEDIETMVAKLVKQFNRGLIENNQTNEKIRKAFKLDPEINVSVKAKEVEEDALEMKSFDSIESIDQEVWNKYLGHRSFIDWNSMRFLEKSFSGNELPEDNWKFRYYQITDPKGQLILLTFFVIALHKEDMFARSSISKVLEKEREINPYYFTSKGVFMGSLFTEGQHMYIQRESKFWKKALKNLLDALYLEQEKESASNVMLRDLEADDQELNDFIIEQGFAQVDMPESCVLENMEWETEDDFKSLLSRKNRKHFMQEIKRFEPFYDVEVKSQLTNEELKYGISMYESVRKNNFAINSFKYPDAVFYNMNEDPHWEFIVLYLKEDVKRDKLPVSICYCHKNVNNVYSPTLIGLDYTYLLEYGVYRQTIHQIIKRAKALQCAKVNFGISATVEKKKVGCVAYPKVAFYQAKDNYAMEVMEATIAKEKD